MSLASLNPSMTPIHFLRVRITFLPVNSSYPSPMLRSTVPKITGPSSIVVSWCKRVEKAAETSAENNTLTSPLEHEFHQIKT